MARRPSFDDRDFRTENRFRISRFIADELCQGSGTLIAIALIAIFRLTPQRVVGTNVFHAAVLLWAAGAAHWIGGNIDFGLAGNILIGSIPGVIIGTRLSVKAPQGFLRGALGVVLIASGATLVLKQGAAGVVPALIVGGVMIALLAALQLIQRSRRRPAAAPA